MKGVYDIYTEALIPLSPRPELIPLLKAVINCGETTKDFVWALRNDRELQTWLRQTVVTMGFEAQNLGLEQVIAMLGQDKVRDILLGRSIERAFVPLDETIVAKHEKGDKKKPPAPGEDDAGTPPPIAEFVNYLAYAKRAEEVANAIRNSYPWQAYVSGLLFDYLNYFVRSKKVTTAEGLQRSDLHNPKAFIETLFYNGLRSAITAIEVLQKISIKYQKNVFVAAMLHDVGKIIQYGVDPVAYQDLRNDHEQKKALGLSVALHETDLKYFPLDHGQLSSIFVGRFPFLGEIERVLDFAHAPKILRLRDSNLYALHAVLKISSDLVKIFQAERATQSDIHKINDEKIRKSEEFLFLKLNPEEWKSVKSNFAWKLHKATI